MIYEQKFILALLQTLLIEIPILVFFVHYLYKDKDYTISGSSIYKTIFIGVSATSLTLPYFWFILPLFIFNRILFVMIGEISIILIEMIFYHQFLDKLNFKKAFVISLAANSTSVIGGLIIKSFE